MFFVPDENHQFSPSFLRETKLFYQYISLRDRYASRAKSIKNKAKINEDPKDALMKQYQKEIEDLRRLLEEGSGDSDENDEEEEEDGEEDDTIEAAVAPPGYSAFSHKELHVLVWPRKHTHPAVCVLREHLPLVLDLSAA